MSDSPDWIPEPRVLARLRRVRVTWDAFIFLIRGGRFKVALDFSGIDPRILRPVTVTRAGRVVDLAHERQNALAREQQAIERQAGLVLAKEGDQGAFLVRWNDSARKAAQENRAACP